ncbi:DUF1905 domain-containing protein [bacterium]|nr:DUF1905 domain-containing protein [bacterium]
MQFTFTAETIEWRGPPPYMFLPIPPDISAQIKSIAAELTYGWGVIPCTATIGSTTFTTSLFPKDGAYLLPVKVAVQRAEQIAFHQKTQATIMLLQLTI